jgi:S-formylglutathione hydrolase FrmB
MRVFLFLLTFSFPLFAAKIETIQTQSAAMQKSIAAIVIEPQNMEKNAKIPAIYLLHPYGGDYRFYLSIAKETLEETADMNGVLIVLADGGYGSWYFDDPNDKNWRYETYIVKELTAQIEAKYPTDARAIAGFSMGGHGALFLAMRNPNVFGAAGSMAGGVDLLPFYRNWELTKRLGDPQTNREAWIENAVINMVDRYDLSKIKIRIDCGREDFFYESNAALIAKLRDRNASFEYLIREGKHDRLFVQSALKDQLSFLAAALRNR